MDEMMSKTIWYILLACGIMHFVACRHQTDANTFVYSDKSAHTENCIMDTLKHYLEKYYWFHTDNDGNIVRSPIVHIQFKNVNEKKCVMYAISPYLNFSSDLEDFERNYYEDEDNHILFCIVNDKQDSIASRFISIFPYVAVDSSFLSRHDDSWFYDGPLYEKFYEIVVSDEKISLSPLDNLLLANP